MSLQLEQDAKVPIQTHIDEFSSRFAIMIFLWIVVTIFWITNIDVVLEKIILTLAGDSHLEELYIYRVLYLRGSFYLYINYYNLK